ncbi:SDR family NAD(P)-dependent oxidoreductase [Microbulbifer epialgicus]|uniref:SDR family NAD(P)-dependent oxidoreductase n=1 Tax=Microbulbifer epialgicus TaxID=393907 RepID=A0ABV4NZ61_9GAMM
MNLSGKVAVITGAGSGIGQALAIALAKKGMKLVLAGFNLSRLESTEKMILEHGAECLCVRADVSKLEDVQNISDKAIERFGRVHLLGNVAGVGPFGTVAETSIEEWRWVLSVNLWGPICGVHVILPHMENQGEGYILSVASESGLYGMGFIGAYNVSKFGVIGLMQSLERDLRASRSAVKTSVFCPGAVKTNILDYTRDQPQEMIGKHCESGSLKEFKTKVEQVVAEGMAPKEAARIIIDGIEQDQFWIFSHSYVAETALRQAEAMVKNNSLIDL